MSFTMQMIMHLFSPEMLELMLIAGCIAMIVGVPKLAWGLIVGAIALAVLPTLLPPLLISLPRPLLILLAVGMAVVILFAVLRLLGNAAIGSNATDTMVGILAADAVRGTARGVFSIAWAVSRGIGRLLLRPFRR